MSAVSDAINNSLGSTDAIQGCDSMLMECRLEKECIATIDRVLNGFCRRLEFIPRTSDYRTLAEMISGFRERSAGLATEVNRAKWLLNLKRETVSIVLL